MHTRENKEDTVLNAFVVIIPRLDVFYQTVFDAVDFVYSRTR